MSKPLRSQLPLDRRHVLMAVAAAVYSASDIAPGRAETPLAQRLRGRRAIPYGVAVNPAYFASDPAYVDAILTHADFIVPEWGMKWADLRPMRDAFNFTVSDQTAQFGQQHGLRVRGHTLVWNEVTPKWLDGIASASEAEREMTRHIERVMLQYKGQIVSWDVVNEPIADKPARGENLREGVWTRRLGGTYIELALKTARQVDPTARLIVNEYGIDHAAADHRAKRASFRQLIRRLLDRGIPLDGIGLQAHLSGDKDIDSNGVSSFVQELRTWGLEVLVTELDVNDKALPADVIERDRRVASTTKSYLEAVLAGGRPSSIATWGLTDRYTWLPTWQARSDGLKNRPLPLDAALQAKPMLAVINDICTRAG